MENNSLWSNQLMACANPLFQLAISFLKQDQEKNSLLNFRDHVILAFDNLERAGFSLKIALPQIQQVKYALAAFIDEIILSSTWEGRTLWMGKPLQLEFFGEHLAGEGFFKRLSELRQNGEQNIDVLEIYFICLQLGFEGIYRLRGLESLAALQVDLRNQIELIRGGIDPKLAPESLLQSSLTNKIGHRLPYWVIVSITLASVFFIYLGCTIIIDKHARKALIQINSSKSMLIEALTREAFKPEGK